MVESTVVTVMVTVESTVVMVTVDVDCARPLKRLRA